MTLFVDASALVAIIAFEPERDAFIDAIATTGRPLWSPMSCWETVSSLCSSYDLAFQEARQRVSDTTDTAQFDLVAVGAEEMRLALDAYQTYGRRSRHPARLNMGDCFAYACTKTNGAKLLYKGDDFIHTDLK